MDYILTNIFVCKCKKVYHKDCFEKIGKCDLCDTTSFVTLSKRENITKFDQSIQDTINRNKKLANKKIKTESNLVNIFGNKK